MRTPMRAARRLIPKGCLGLAALSLLAVPGRAAAPPEKSLPDSTVFFLKVADATAFRDSFRQSQLGQLWADPAMTPFKDDMKTKLADASKSMKEKVGLSLKELLELPQGPISFAVLPKDDADIPASVIITADAGKNEAKLTEVLTKATAQGETSGAKVVKQEFKGLTFHVITPPKDKDAKADAKPDPPGVWTHDGPLFYFGTDIDSLKDAVSNAPGREKSLESTENFAAARKKLGTDGQVVWFADMGKLLNLVAKAGAKGKNADAFKQFETFSQVLGINGLKAAGGSYTMKDTGFDSVSKTFVVAPAPLQGLLKLFALPRVVLQPEPWVPATVASYQSWSWDLDAAFTAINDLANMFQPGVLNVLEQQLVGPNGGEPLNFKKDVFDPLGNRITVISDFKKPVTEQSQRMLIGVALEDEKAFQNTLKKVIALTGGAPKTREFQGATIYDFEIPEIPNANAGNVPFKGPVSLTINKKTLFLSTEPTLLEQAVRGGGATLADSTAYQSVAKKMPEKLSAVTYVRPEESARATYEMIKSGQFEKALAQGAAAGGGGNAPNLGKIFDKDKLPEFSVFAKYLSQGGGYAVMEDDGVLIQNFTLRKSTP